MFENILSALDTKRPSVGEQIYEHFLYDMMTGTITGHVGELNGKVVVPDEIKGVEIRTIGAGAFTNCTGITSVEIKDGVAEIETGAFSGCGSLIDLKLPAKLKYIGEGAFMGCGSLADVSIPDGTAHIAERAFFGCDLHGKIKLPASVEYVADDAFGSD